MAIIPQLRLFGWREIEELGDLERLRLVLEYMPDEKLMRQLEKERYKGRNDYPLRAMWNSVLAGLVFQQETIEKLRRELARNGQLRQMCGFFNQVPPAWVYTRFLKKLLNHTEEIEEIFERLVTQLPELLPDLGKHLAIDSKAISSFARRKNGNEAPDGRRDTVASTQTVASGKGLLFRYKSRTCLTGEMEVRPPELLGTAETLVADKGYDDSKLIKKCLGSVSNQTGNRPTPHVERWGRRTLT
jgi:hypothetical protein